MESCFSVKEPLRGIRDTGMRTDLVDDWVRIPWSTPEQRIQVLRYLQSKPYPGTRQYILCNACQPESYVTMAVVTNGRKIT